MTGGGDLDEIEDDDVLDGDDDDDEDDDDDDGDDDDDTVEGDDIAPPVAEAHLKLDLNDRIPSAGAADIGGRAADDPDATTS
jgi:hypothetical protein